MLIDCPYCGTRSIQEFSYAGDASVQRPTDYSAEANEAWLDYVYYRANPRGRLWELWQHADGCRAWLKVERDTLSHEIFAVQLVGNR